MKLYLSSQEQSELTISLAKHTSDLQRILVKSAIASEQVKLIQRIAICAKLFAALETMKYIRTTAEFRHQLKQFEKASKRHDERVLKGKLQFG